MTTRTRIGVAAVCAFIATVWLANWAVTRYGVVNVGFGLVAPAGVYFAGLALTLRDVTQATLGRRAVIIAILLGASLAYLVAPALAVASATAFLVSELADLVVYTPLAERQFVSAVVASNIVGAIIDSALFLWLAFDSLEFFRGQVVGKLWMTILVLPLLLLRRRLIPAV